MADTKFTILGMTGSGKTCYLLGMYYKMLSGMEGYTITTDDNNDVKLRRRYAKLCNPSLGPDRFPAGTDTISEYVFELQRGFDPIMSFDWMDYPGGILDTKGQDNLEEYENVKRSIMQSSSLFICVDGSLLCGEDKNTKIKRVKNECSAIINPFFSQYLKENHTLPPTAIVVTKYDMCRNDTDEYELCDIIENSFSPFFEQNGNYNRTVAIIPVSIGTNISDEQAGELKPLNIHVPIFMGIWFALRKKIQDESKKLDESSAWYSYNIESLRNKKAKEENKWIFKSNSEIQRLEKEIQKLQSKAKQDKDNINERIARLNFYRDKLYEELRNITHIYIDGQKTTFDGILGR